MRPTAALLRAGALVVALAALLVPLRAVLRAGPTDFDDAYMYLRYAAHLRAGAGLVWNAGEAPVNGVTSLPHLLLVTALRAALPRLADGRLLQLASAAAAALALAVTVLVCARAARHPRLRGERAVWAALIVPAAALTDAFAFHAHTGMDTMLALAASAAVAGAALRLAERPTTGAAAAAAVVGWLAVETRPDLALVAASTPALMMLLHGGRGRPLLVFLVGLAALAGASLACKRALLGTALPLSFWAKRPGHYAAFAGEWGWNPFLFLRVFLGAALPFLAALALVGRRSWRPVAALLAPAALTWAALFFPNQIMGHMGRFFFPTLPLLAVAAAIAVDRLVTAPDRLTARLAGAAAALMAGGPLLEAAARRWEAPARAQRLADLGGFVAPAPLPPVDSWRAAGELAAVLAAAPPGTVAAMSEHGLPGARAPAVTIVDVLGLHDPSFALRPFEAAALWRRRPDLIWMPHPDHTAMLRQILDSPELWGGYDFAPDAFHFGPAIRHEGTAALRRALAARWAVLHPGTRFEDHLARPAR